MLARKIHYRLSDFWESLDGRRTAIRDMKSLDLVNALHMTRYLVSLTKISDPIRSADHEELLFVMSNEARHRHVRKAFIYGAPYPFKDRSGSLRFWSYGFNQLAKPDKNHPMMLSQYQQDSLIKAAGLRMCAFASNGHIFAKTHDASLLKLCEYGYLCYPEIPHGLSFDPETGRFDITESGKQAALMIKAVRRLEADDREAGRI